MLSAMSLSTWWILSFISCFIVFNVFWTLHLFHSGPCAIEIHDNKSSSTIPQVTPQLEGKRCQPNTEAFSFSLPAQSKNVKSTLAFGELNLDIGRSDSQRLYKLYDFALVGDSFTEATSKSLVCLATQTSVERMHSLAQVASQWKGPISVGVFVAGNEEFSILQYYVTYLRLCFDFIAANVTFHVAAPVALQPSHTDNTLEGLANKFDCQYPEKTLRKLLNLRTADIIRWRIKHEYPQNHMRNMARKGCQNSYVFLTDIDIIPSRNTFALLNNFLRSSTCAGLCAYVIPTFEIDVRAKFPSSRADLIRIYKKGLARPFHEKVFIYNQYATNFSSWVSNTNDNADIRISHKVTNFEFLYEPFYVALDNAPVHDERFIGYGFTRNSQVYEMYVAGYEFYVLTPVFTCHWGLQQKKTRPAWREQQNNINRKRFETFKSEIFARYKNDPLLMFKKKLKPTKT